MGSLFEQVKKEAESLGFILEDREWDADDIVEDEETGKEREVRVHCRAYKVSFPPDYPHPPLYIDKNNPEEAMPGIRGCQVRSLRQMIALYHNRFEEWKQRKEWNKQMAGAMSRFVAKFEGRG